MNPLHRGVALLAALLLPWMLALGSHSALERWLPGQVPTPVWAWFATSAFLVCSITAIALVVKARAHVALRTIFAILIGVVGLWFAFAFQLRSSCGDYRPYVGQAVPEVVASCS